MAFQEYAWRRIKNIAATSCSLSMGISLAPRSDNGLFKNAPMVTAMPPVSISVNQLIAINIEVREPDGDTFRCRCSTNSGGVNELGQACPPTSLPRNTTIYPNCTILITGESINDWQAVCAASISSMFQQSIYSQLIYFPCSPCIGIRLRNKDASNYITLITAQIHTVDGLVYRVHLENTLSITFSTLLPMAQIPSPHCRLARSI